MVAKANKIMFNSVLEEKRCKPKKVFVQFWCSVKVRKSQQQFFSKLDCPKSNRHFLNSFSYWAATFWNWHTAIPNRGLQGKPCNKNRDPAMRTGVPCNENRVFPVGLDSQGVPCELYRVWVCSAFCYLTFS